MGVTPIELGPFTGGVNLVDPITKLNPDELSLCRNFRIGIRGDFYKRPGHGNYGASATVVNGSNLVNLLCRYYKSDGSKKLIAAAGGKLKFGDDAAGTWTDISINGAAASMGVALADWMVYKDRLYITDGTNPQRYNGTDDIYAGHYVHTAPTGVQAAGSNIANGTYYYIVTSNAGDMGEGIKSATSLGIVVSGGPKQINLTIDAAAPAKHGETTKRIYRTKVTDTTIFYFVAEIATATTAFSDTFNDTALGDEYVPVHAPRATAKYVIMGHDERAYWFGMSADASLVEVSDIGFPDRVKDLDFFTVSNNDGDILTGGGLVPGGTVFFKKTSIWLLRAFGSGITNIYPREKKGAGVGTLSHFSIVTTPVGLIFLSHRGEIYKFDGTNIEEIGRRVASEFKGMTQTSLAKVVACYHDYRYIISYDYRGQKGYNWKTLEYDTVGGKWEGPHENGDLYNPSYYSVFDSQLDSGELYWGEGKAATGSYVYGRTEFTNADRGSKFISRIKTGALPLGNLREVKSTKIFIHGEFSSDAVLTFTHIDEAGLEIAANLTIPAVAGTVKWNDGIHKLGPDVNAGKFGGSVAQVLQGSLGLARARLPKYQLSDDGTATMAKMTLFRLLAEFLPLK